MLPESCADEEEEEEDDGDEDEEADETTGELKSVNEVLEAATREKLRTREGKMRQARITRNMAGRKEVDSDVSDTAGDGGGSNDEGGANWSEEEETEAETRREEEIVDNDVAVKAVEEEEGEQDEGVATFT